MIEGLSASAVIGIVTYITVFVTTKNKTEANQRELESLRSMVTTDTKELHKRLERHGDDIVRLNTQSQLAITAKDVDDKYVSKEYYKQSMNHIDQRFDDLKDGQRKILAYIEKTVVKT